MRSCFSGVLVMAAVLGLSSASFAQGSSGNVKEAQAALEKAKDRVKQAEAALEKAQGKSKAQDRSKGGETRRGPQGRRSSGGESRRGPQGRRPSSDDFKKRMEAFSKAMQERVDRHKAASANFAAERKGGDGES